MTTLVAVAESRRFAAKKIEKPRQRGAKTIKIGAVKNIDF